MLIPCDRRHDLAQPFEVESCWLPSIDNRFLNVGCEEGQTQQPAHLAAIEVLTLGQCFDARDFSALDPLAPNVGAAKSAEKDFIVARRDDAPVLLAPTFDAFGPATALQPS